MNATTLGQHLQDQHKQTTGTGAVLHERGNMIEIGTENALSMIKDLLMPPHLLRQRLRAEIVQRAHYASVVENLQRRLSDELLDVNLVMVIAVNGSGCDGADRVVCGCRCFERVIKAIG